MNRSLSVVLLMLVSAFGIRSSHAGWTTQKTHPEGAAGCCCKGPAHALISHYLHDWSFCPHPPRGPVVSAMAGPRTVFSQESVSPDALRALAKMLESQKDDAAESPPAPQQQPGRAGGKGEWSPLADPGIPGPDNLEDEVKELREQLKDFENLFRQLQQQNEKLQQQNEQFQKRLLDSLDSGN